MDLYREIKFRNSKQTYRGIPIIASNMDTVGTFEMASCLAKVIFFLPLEFFFISYPMLRSSVFPGSVWLSLVVFFGKSSLQAGTSSSQRRYYELENAIAFEIVIEIEN